MPLLSVLTVASRYLPLGLPGWFALVTGVGHALPSIGVFWLLAEGLALRSTGALAIAAVLAVGIAFTGIPLATILFPHPEIILAGGLILVFAAIALEHYRIAAALLVFTLLVREDAGFHAFGVLFLLGAANWLRGVSWREQRPIADLGGGRPPVFRAASAFKQVVFPGQPSLFVLDYLGNPPFSNTSVQQVLLNLIGLPFYRAYVFWPAVVAVAWAMRSRNVLIVLGYLAFCPWLLLHLMANRDILRTLSGYYSFPFLVACVWPLAAVIIDARQRGCGLRQPDDWSGFGIMLALSFVGLSEPLESGSHGSLEELHDPAVARARTRDRSGCAGTACRGGNWCCFSFWDDLHGPERLFVCTVFVRRARPWFGRLSAAAACQQRADGHVRIFRGRPDIQTNARQDRREHLTHEYCFTDTAIRWRATGI